MDAAVAAQPPEGVDLAEVGDALAHGALLGARGNSGIILSQLIRGFAVGAHRARGPSSAAPVVASALAAAARSAYDAVATPVEGTVLTVARVAAEHAAAVAERQPRGRCPRWSAPRRRGAREALARTPEQLEVLARAGVVDAGGRGLVVLLRRAGGRWSRARARPCPTCPHRTPVPREPEQPDRSTPVARVRGHVPARRRDDRDPGAARPRSPASATRVVVGGEGSSGTSTSTSTTSAPALEAGIAAGRPHRIRVTHSASGPHRAAAAPGRGLVVVTARPGLGRAVGARPAPPVVAAPTGRGAVHGRAARGHRADRRGRGRAADQRRPDPAGGGGGRPAGPRGRRAGGGDPDPRQRAVPGGAGGARPRRRVRRRRDRDDARPARDPLRGGHSRRPGGDHDGRHLPSG